MINTATITFHAAHNYGSMLQAFALQKTIKTLGYNNDIINLRTSQQKRLYAKVLLRDGTWFQKLRRFVLYLPYLRALTVKYNLFEDFLRNELTLTNEFNSLDSILDANLDYDCFISGGDQIWNTAPVDFDWSYFLPFTDKKKISYAVSMGPRGESQVSNIDKIRNYLMKYSHISVREVGTQKIIESLTKHPVDIVLDPVLLLQANEWKQHINRTSIIEGDYILLYVPGGYKKEVFDVAASIGKILKIKVITTLFTPQCYLYPTIKCKLAIGPWEFLNLVENAQLVVSGSYHAILFATLFSVPFWAVNGNTDNRINTFLKRIHLENRSVSCNDWQGKIKTALECNFACAEDFLEKQRERSLDFLNSAIKY